MLTVADMGEGGVKNGQKTADVLYGRPHSMQKSMKRGFEIDYTVANLHD